MSDFYGRNSGENENANMNNSSVDNQNREDSNTIYSYSYVNSSSKENNPNYTSGYSNGENRYNDDARYSGYYSQYNTQESSNGSSNRNNKKEKKEKTSFGKLCLRALSVAVIFGVVVTGCFVGGVKLFGIDFTNPGTSKVIVHDSGTVKSIGTEMATATSISDIAEAAMPSIVAINNTSEETYQTFFGYQTQEVQSAGTGIIIGEDEDYLYIVTNNHVVENSLDLNVAFVDNETVEASVKGAAAGSDLAVVTVRIKDIKEETLKAIKIAELGSSDDSKVGEQVIAIGNALGYGQSVTVGYISALNRLIEIDGNKYSYMQVDAAINPGNSGGALLNLQGQVIGINSAKYSDTSVEGVGLAIPISDAKPIIETIITRNEIPENDRGYLGIYGNDVTDDIAKVYRLPVGVYISELVNGGAAEEAGLHVGDIITKIDGINVSSMSELQTELQYYKYGTTVKISAMVNQNGEYVEKEYEVVLQSKRENR